MPNTWWRSVVKGGAFVPVAGRDAWPKVRRYWSMKSCLNSLCASGCLVFRSSYAFCSRVPGVLEKAAAVVNNQLKPPTTMVLPTSASSPLDFIARLVALVPKPRVNLTRFAACLRRTANAAPWSSGPSGATVRKPRGG